VQNQQDREQNQRQRAQDQREEDEAAVKKSHGCQWLTCNWSTRIASPSLRAKDDLVVVANVELTYSLSPPDLPQRRKDFGLQSTASLRLRQESTDA
jgi:hypothetical protein